MGPDGRDPRARVAPLAATLLLVLLAPAALLLGGLSVMATDSCGPDNCSSALVTSLDLIHAALSFGGLLTVAAWVTAWTLPPTRRWSAARAWTAALSLLPSLFVVYLVCTLPAP